MLKDEDSKIKILSWLLKVQRQFPVSLEFFVKNKKMKNRKNALFDLSFDPLGSPIVVELFKMVTYRKEFPPINFHDTLMGWSCELT